MRISHFRPWQPGYLEGVVKYLARRQTVGLIDEKPISPLSCGDRFSLSLAESPANPELLSNAAQYFTAGVVNSSFIWFGFRI